MGNQQSGSSLHEGERPHPLTPFSRYTGTLGLSRQELDKRCQPSGLYESCQWEDRAIRKLIADGRMAARLKGADDRRTEGDQECPVCMLYYTEANVTKCCSAAICTECYLQIRPQKIKTAACPYCNSDKFSISVAKKPTVEDIDARNKEEQTVIEARIRANKSSSGGGGLGLKPAPTDPVKEGGSVSKKYSSVAPDTTSTTSTSTNGFGSELAKDERFLLLKKRSESFASNEGVKTPDKDREIIQSIAMTPEERRRLEEEMKAQLNHPLTLQVEAEAEQRRADNEREFYRNNPAGAMRAQRSAELRRLGGLVGESGSRRGRGGPRDWNSIVDHFERGGNGEVGSLDDLVVLEAAILLSMEQEARRSQEGGRDSSSGFDANRHARDGFPLVRSLLSGQGSRSSRRGGDGSGSTASSSSSTATGAAGQAQSLAGGSASVRRRNQGLLGDTALGAASMMMRGISEEEQIAMAIAASLQDQNSSNTDDNNTGAIANNATATESSSSSGRGSNSNDDDDNNDEHPAIERADGTQDDTNSSTIDGDSEANTITELAEVVTSGASGGQSDQAVGTPSVASHEEAVQVSDDGKTSTDDV